MQTWLKRIFLFALVNVLIVTSMMAVFSIATQAFGLSFDSSFMLLLAYAIIGMGGAFINLSLSRILAKSFLGVQLIDPSRATGRERELVDMIYRLAQKAGLPTMPEVGIYASDEINAFATGPSRSRSLVAISSGLLMHMEKDAVEGVLGHEITHIANGDMVTMTLIQGLINTMILIAARTLANIIASQFDSRVRRELRWVIFWGLQILLSLLGTIAVCYFSRRREYRADAGGSRLAGRAKMLEGLKSLRSVYGQTDASGGQTVATLKISGRASGLFAAAFSTHPPLEDRIRRLETGA